VARRRSATAVANDGPVVGVDDRRVERPAQDGAQQDGGPRGALVEDRRLVLTAEQPQALAGATRNP